MKPRMTWKIRAVGPVELTTRLLRPGAVCQGRQGDRREGHELWGLRSDLLVGCVTLDKCLSLSEPPFTDAGNDTSLPSYLEDWDKCT